MFNSSNGTLARIDLHNREECEAKTNQEWNQIELFRERLLSRPVNDSLGFQSATLRTVKTGELCVVLDQKDFRITYITDYMRDNDLIDFSNQNLGSKVSFFDKIVVVAKTHFTDRYYSRVLTADGVGWVRSDILSSA